MVTKALDKCRDKVTEEYRTYMSLYRDEEAVEGFLKSLENKKSK